MMVTTKIETEELYQLDEMVRLEVIDKKLEIQKKQLDLEKEKRLFAKFGNDAEKEKLDLLSLRVSLRNKMSEVKKIDREIEDLKQEKLLDEARLLNDKIFALLMTLTVTVVDEERTILGSEPLYTPIITGKRRDIALDKLMELIHKI